MKKDPFIVVLTKIMSKVDDHRSVILLANGFAELLIEAMIKSKCKNWKRILDDKRSYPYSIKLVILNELDVVSDRQLELFDWMRKLRNKAAHDPFFEISQAEIKKIHDEGDTTLIHMVCINIISLFWNDNIEILGPLFAPNTMNGQFEKNL